MKFKAFLLLSVIACISLQPAVVSAQKFVTKGSTPQAHSLSVCSDGTVMAWGDNSMGQLGTGNNISSTFPVSVTGLSHVSTVEACSTSSFARLIDSTVWAWGDNYYGQLGNGNNTNSNIPIQITSLSKIVQVAGGAYYALALKNDSTVWAWGGSYDGALGLGTTYSSNVPVLLDTLTGIVEIFANSDLSLALQSDGTIWEWGYRNSSNVPVIVKSLPGTISITAHYALKNDGTVWKWTDAVPTQLNSLSGIVEISTGYSHNIALKNDGSVWTWGFNYEGQLGTGNNTNSTNPVQVSSLTDITSTYAGGHQSLCLKNDGTLWAFGENASGQLGDSTTTNRNVPVQVSALCMISSPTCTANYTTLYDSTLNNFTLTIDSLTSATAVSYYWNFGDGTTSALANPTHVYSDDSVYTVCMEVTNASGAFCSYCHEIGKDSSGNIIRAGGFSLNVQNGNIATGIQKSVSIDEVMIYPNPSNGLFSIKTNNTNAYIEIYNLLGDKIYASSPSKQQLLELNFLHSQKGLYLVRILDGKTIQTKKLIIQ